MAPVPFRATRYIAAETATSRDRAEPSFSSRNRFIDDDDHDDDYRPDDSGTMHLREIIPRASERASERAIDRSDLPASDARSFGCIA